APSEASGLEGPHCSGLTVSVLDSNRSEDVSPIYETPGLMSFLAKGDLDTDVPGVNSLIPAYEEAYGTHMPEGEMYGEYSGQEVDYQPSMFITYWGFRLMIGFGVLAAPAAAFALIVPRRGPFPGSRFLPRLPLVGF